MLRVAIASRAVQAPPVLVSSRVVPPVKSVTPPPTINARPIPLLGIQRERGCGNRMSEPRSGYGATPIGAGATGAGATTGGVTSGSGSAGLPIRVSGGVGGIAVGGVVVSLPWAKVGLASAATTVVAARVATIVKIARSSFIALSFVLVGVKVRRRR
jgi:hypothetical protein